MSQVITNVIEIGTVSLRESAVDACSRLLARNIRATWRVRHRGRYEVLVRIPIGEPVRNHELNRWRKIAWYKERN